MRLVSAVAGVFFLVLILPGARAQEWTPFQLSLWPPAQICPEDTPVYGLRLCLPYGSNAVMYGLDLGFAAVAGEAVSGIQVSALANVAKGTSQGLQIAGLVNLSAEEVQALQIALIANLSTRAPETLGMQIGAVNAAGAFSGAQVGVANVSSDMEGLQLGLVNYAGELHGLQIGLANINADGPRTFLPLVNWCY